MGRSKESCFLVTSIGKVSGYVSFGPGKFYLIHPVVDLVEMITDLRVRVHVHCDAFGGPHTSEIMSSCGDNESIQGEEREGERERDKSLLRTSEICKCGRHFFHLTRSIFARIYLQIRRNKRMLAFGFWRTRASLETITRRGKENRYR